MSLSVSDREAFVFNVVELFSGIGSQARALQNIRKDINVV